MSISFQGYPKSRPVVNGLASSSSQTQRSSFLSPQKGRFRVFFWAKSIFPAKRLTFAYSMPYIFWKLYIKGFKWNFLGQYWSILLGVRILLELVHLRFYNIWDCVIYIWRGVNHIGRLRLAILRRLHLFHLKDKNSLIWEKMLPNQPHVCLIDQPINWASHWDVLNS